MSDFKPKTTVASNLPAVENGSLIATTDTGDLYVDSGNKRIKLTDVIIGTYSGIRNLLAPLSNKIYFATDTHQLLHYSGGSWTVLNSSSGSGEGNGGTQIYGSPRALITRADLGAGSSVVNDNERGYASVDLQAQRADENDFAKGDFSFLYGRNCAIVANNGYAFGTGTAFDVEGAIQTNHNKAGTHGWKGHTGVLGLCFAPNGHADVEIFTLDTGAIALFDVDIIAVSDGRLTLYKLALSVYQGSLTVNYDQFTPICQWTPNFYLSDNKLYLTGGYADVVQVGIRYTILGASTSDDGASSSGGEE